MGKPQNIKLMAFDVDGVMSDGKVIYTDRGAEIKAFNAQDGLGLVIARAIGLKIAVITGRVSAIVERRFAELKVDHLVMGSMDKTSALKSICEKEGITLDEVAYMGDDLNDLGCMSIVGYPMTVANGRSENKAHAAYITEARGGDGAVREAVEHILKEKNLWDTVVERFITETYAK